MTSASASIASAALVLSVYGCDDDDCDDDDCDDADPGFNPFAVDTLLEPEGGVGVAEGVAEAEEGVAEDDGFIVVGPGGGGL